MKGTDDDDDDNDFYDDNEWKHNPKSFNLTKASFIRSVLSNPRPAGRMPPADRFHAARQCWLNLLEI